MPTFDPNYLLTATQLTIIVYLIVIVFNIVFWVVDSLRGKSQFPGQVSPPLFIVSLGLILGFIVALPISIVSYSLLQWLNPVPFLLRAPAKVIVFSATCLLVMVEMDLVVVLVERLWQRTKGYRASSDTQFRPLGKRVPQATRIRNRRAG